MSDFVLLAARLLNGALAGIYLAFLVAFMPALHSQPDDTYARVMNRLNVVIVNPAFMVFFLGAPLLAVVVLAWHREPIAILAAVLAVVALVVTFVANLPLNSALASGGSRAAFETPWLVWHTVRTAAAAAAFVLLTVPGFAARAVP
jgi:uncharacterized membrane protein